MKILIFSLVLFAPHILSRENSESLILWNVGQGQWLTISALETCIHIDMGGEFVNMKALQKECGQKENQLFFTHADWDHVSFLKYVFKKLPRTCKAAIDPIRFKNQGLNRIYAALPVCRNTLSEHLRLYTVSRRELMGRKRRMKKLSLNDTSSIWKTRKVLIPGDSTVIAEKIWSKKVTEPKHIKYLVLGHHGSQTSTSEELLNRLPALKLAFVSARRKVYGHPHPKVLERLRRNKLPLVDTESWGNIRLAL